MNIAICDVDGHGYPNLALMRISMWHKRQGDTVEWFTPLMPYDRVYASKVFTFTPDNQYLPDDTVRGGTGYDVTKRLPAEIENTEPDYTIYPQFDSAYGFLTRGCINKCPWCVVPRKEGDIRAVAEIGDICRTNTGFRKKVILMDNNFLAAPIDFCREQVAQMIRLKLKVDFNQATDARLYNDDTASFMAKIPYLQLARLSCDTDAMIPHCIKAIKLLRKYGCRKDIFIYVLAKNEEIPSALHRIRSLTAVDSRVVPFVMPFRSLTDNSILPNVELKRLARWCNRAWIRKSCAFEDYH